MSMRLKGVIPDPDRGPGVISRDVSGNGSLVIEVVGLMGSGKSSVLREVLAQTADVLHGWSLRRPRYLPVMALTALRFPFRARWFDPRRSEQSGRILRLIWRLDAELETLGRRKRRGGTGAVLFDEGPVFKLCWLMVAAHEAGLKGRVFDRWCHDAQRRCGEVIDRLVWLDAPDETLLERIQNRPNLSGYGIKHMPDQEACRMIRLYRTTYQGIISSLITECGLEVTSYKSAEQTVCEIATDLSHFIDANRQGSCVLGNQ